MANRARVPRQPKPSPRAERKNSRRNTGWRPWSRLNAYFAHHRVSALDALMRMLRVPGQSLPTCLVIAIAIALPALLFVGLSNLQGQAERWQAPVQLSVFLHPRASERAVDELANSLSASSLAIDVEYLSPEAAVSEFQRASGLGDVLSSLSENPLPGVLVITAAQASVVELDHWQQEIAEHPIVDLVQLDLEWVARLNQLVELAEKAVVGLALLLGVGVILVTGNVIRLAIASRKDEIVIAKLVGASDGFVRRPFLYTGIWYGFFGGVLALTMLIGAGWWLAGPISRLAELYGSQAQWQGLGFQSIFAIVFGASLLGCLGAWLSVARHLRDIRPT